MKNLLIDVIDPLWNQIFSRPVLVVIFGVVICSILGAGLAGLKLNASYNAYFDASDPILREHRSLQTEFSISDGLLIVLEFGDSAALEQPALKLLDSLSRALLALDSVSEVTSILDLSSEDDAGFDELDQELFSFEELVEQEPIVAVPNVEAVMNDPRGPGLLLSNDQSALVLELTLNLPEETSAASLLRTLSDVRLAVEKELESTEANVRFSGPLALNEAYISVVRHDLKIFLPVLVLSMALVLTLMFGSLKITAIALATAFASTISAFGVAGWLGYELAAINAFAPVMITSLALAGAVHILNSYHDRSAAGAEKCAAISTSIIENVFPLSLTSLTTAGGFLALLYSPSPPIRTIGFIVALGVLFSWFYLVLLFPALLKLTSARPKRTEYLGQIINVVGMLTTRYPKQIVLCLTALSVISIPLVLKNQINDNVFEYFPETHQFKRDLDVLNAKFSGINPHVFSVSADRALEVLDVNFISALDKFQQWLNVQPEVHKTLSIVQFPMVRKQLDNPTENALEHYRELAKLHTPHGLGIEKLIDKRYQTVAIRTYVDTLDSKSLIDFNQRAKRKLKSFFPGQEVLTGGTSLVFAHLGQRNATSMMYALIVAVFVISIICMLVLKTVHGIWIGALCNLLPVSIVYAWWALIDGNISIGGAVVIGMILGIVVDDTLYLLVKFRRAISGGESFPAIATLSNVGPALVVTSVTIMVGLAAGLFSDFRPIQAMSGLSIGVILLAMIIDLLGLTIILNWLGKRYQATAK